MFGRPTTTTNSYGVYGEETDCVNGTCWAGYFDGRVRIVDFPYVASSGVQRLRSGALLTETSDRIAKTDFADVDPRPVLARVAALPIQTWSFKSEPGSVRHMGPMAQDFHAAFGLGQDDKHIATVDSGGVSLAAIQGLYEILQEKEAEIEELRQRLDRLERAGGE